MEQFELNRRQALVAGGTKCNRICFRIILNEVK